MINKDENPNPPKRRPTTQALRSLTFGLTTLSLTVCALILVLTFPPGAC